MLSLSNKCRRLISFSLSLIFSVFIVAFSYPQTVLATGNGINVILMIGDGMGWNMTRAAAVARGGDFYTAGKGSGLSMQTLTGYGLVTTFGTTIQRGNGAKSTGNSALDGSNPVTGASQVIEGFSFNSSPLNPGNRSDGNSTNPGNVVGYDISQGGPTPWIPLTPARPGSYNKEYIKYSYPDSANTATTLYTGVKSYNNAMGVDIYEKKLTTILEIAKQQGKSTGLVTSVPVSHATPGAAASFVNRRNKYDSIYDPKKTNQDSILQQTLLDFQPNVLLGGGHPLDLSNSTATGSVCKYTYITEDTYRNLSGKTEISHTVACAVNHRANPNLNNRYGYTFLERGPNASEILLQTAANTNPNNGDKLFGLYGARGQDGNIPVSSSQGDYSLTGLGQFTLYSSVVKTGTTSSCASGKIIAASTNECIPVVDRSGNPTTANSPNTDTVRPLAPGETNASFIAREINENPTLEEMTKAALTVLGKDRDGFWLMVEGGDIDWAAHDNNMDNLIGTVNDFDKAVKTVIDWINNNGGWKKNLLIVTADHDHYLTLNDDFLQKLTPQDGKIARGLKYNAKDITFIKHNPRDAGHFWGSDPTQKYLWGNHTRRPVPVYYQGAYSGNLTIYAGQNVKFTDSTGSTYTVPGRRGLVDQTHIFQTMKRALTAPHS
jgi:alkaline phosphatase